MVALRILFVVAGTICTCGCLLVSGEQRVKPVGSNMLWRKNQPDYYVRQVNLSDFALNVGVPEYRIRWQAPFLFWVLPLPSRYHWNSTTLSFHVEIETKAAGVSLDPWRTFCVMTNNLRKIPAKAWQDHLWLGTNSLIPVVPTNTNSFTLEYALEWTPDMPFTLEIEGISVFGRRVPVSIPFEPERRLCAHFELPY